MEKSSLAQASANVARYNEEAKAKRSAIIKARPRLSRESMMECIDWTLDHADVLGAAAATHMQAIELAIRTLATEAQGKATAHSDGTGLLG